MADYYRTVSDLEGSSTKVYNPGIRLLLLHPCGFFYMYYITSKCILQKIIKARLKNLAFYFIFLFSLHTHLILYQF